MNKYIMDDKIVLICATGRSGSTTLQRIINTIPDSNICGVGIKVIKMHQHIFKEWIKNYLNFINKIEIWCYFTTFERMFDRNNLQNIFSFIDCREKYNEEKVSEVLNNNLKD